MANRAARSASKAAARSESSVTANIEPKGFETALCVPERHPSRESHDQIEHTAGLFAPPRLPNTDQTAIKRARTERKIDISVSDRLDHFRNLAQRCGKIGVEKQSDWFCCRKQSGSHGCAFSAIRKILEQSSLDFCTR